MVINAMGSSNIPYFSSFTVQLADDAQSRYTVISIPFNPPVRPLPPSPPSIPPFVLPVEQVRTVPEELHADPLFQENTDPISLAPLRDPVADRNEPKHIYERETIVRWLRENPTSPQTRQPMTENDLVPVPQLKEKINEKIREYLQQKRPELLAEHEAKVREAEREYQRALHQYHTVEIPQHENGHNLPLPQRVALCAMRCFDGLRSLFNPYLNELRERLYSLSANQPIFSQIGHMFRRALGVPEANFKDQIKEIP